MREPRPHRKRVPLSLAVVALAILVIVGTWGWSATTGRAATQYVTTTVVRGTLTVAVEGNGSVACEHSAAVDPPLAGTVSELTASLGSHVATDDILFVIDNPDLDANVAQARAQYRSAQSSLLKASQTRAQASRQKVSTVLQAKSQYLQAQSATAKAKQAYASAQAAPADSLSLEAAQSAWEAAVAAEQSARLAYLQAADGAIENYAYADAAYNAAASLRTSAKLAYSNAVAAAKKRTVRAPISGYVTTLSIQNGDQLGSGSRTVTTPTGSSASAPMVISDLSSLQAQVRISETDRSVIQLGQKRRHVRRDCLARR